MLNINTNFILNNGVQMPAIGFGVFKASSKP